MNMTYKAFLYILFIPLIVCSQQQNIRFERITVEDGLTNGAVQDILQDQQGFMWFATWNGVSKYDGYTFTTYQHDPDDSTSIGENSVFDIYEDRRGVLWFATVGGGLSKFDPKKERFTNYRHDPNDPHSISSSQVKCTDSYMYNDKDILWIGTAYGLNKFDPVTEKFTWYPHTSLGHPYRFVESLAVDTCGMVWVGCIDGGLHKFNPQTERYTHYVNDPNDPTTLPGNTVTSMLVDRSGDLWVGILGGGLAKFDPENERFISYRYNPNDPTSLSHDAVVCIFEDSAGTLWVGTSEGLNTFDREKELFIQYKHNPDDPYSISDNLVLCINEDNSGNLWIGTWNGLNKIDPQKNQFSHIKHIPGNNNSLSANYVTALYESRYGGENILWIGTKNGGVNKLNRATGKWSCYRHDPKNPSSLIHDFVYAVCEDHLGNLWIGNFHGGLNKLDRRTRKIIRYPYDPNNPNSLTCPSVRSIVEDDNGLMWIGTQTGGINTFDPISEQFALVGDKMHVVQIYKDSSGDLWFATMRGLKKYDQASGDYVTYRHNPEDSTSISDNNILSIFESKSGDLWVGTFGSGLNLFDRNSGKFICFTVKDGLISNIIAGILEDKQNNLWISTDKGISKFNPKNKNFKNYDHHDGLISDEFNELSSFRNRDGEIFFGTPNGLNVFNPEDIRDNTYIPPVVITNFRIFNKPVAIKKNEMEETLSEYLLPQHISTLNDITLSYRESVFSFEFAALNYHSPQRNRYAYKMEGVDPDWVYTDASRRFATYTNLNPGEYIFHVKGSNNNGVWNEEGTALKIIITPPWWLTNLAYICYVILFGLAVIASLRIYTGRLKLKQQMAMKDFEAEKLREVDTLKSRFFANISHEFRTPLTLIMGPVKQLLSSEIRETVKNQYKIILRSSDRLLGLINQILDLSKLESGKMQLQTSKTDIVPFVKGLVLSFCSLAETRKITLKVEIKEKECIGYIDRDKAEKIITNLLSNAFKFTPEGGEITVNVKIPNSKHEILNKFQIPNPKLRVTSYQLPVTNSKSPSTRHSSPVTRHDFIEISISNTSPFIPKEQLDKLFDRFYQADSTYKKDGEGSGIGLALTKELVEACHGEIRVQCNGIGSNAQTIFTVVLPIGKEHLKPEEIAEEFAENERKTDFPLRRGTKGDVALQHSYEEIDKSEDKLLSKTIITYPLLLIVEDNPDVTHYIRSFMETDYRILTAENGAIGLKKALKEYPDLIISDVMMPEMDGYELCQKIKSDQRTSHIPVILLTAKADLDSRIEGLEFGADDYIAKPFEAGELKVRSKNLIRQRKRLRDKFSQAIEIKPGEVTASSMDEQFLDRLLMVFEKHVSDSGFSTERFAGEVGLSRSQLNRKLRALTDLSIHGFLLNLRLKRAAQLLKKKTGTVSEIAYAVGFESASNFARAFRSRYGTSPSDFLNRLEE